MVGKKLARLSANGNQKSNDKENLIKSSASVDLEWPGSAERSSKICLRNAGQSSLDATIRNENSTQKDVHVTVASKSFDTDQRDPR